MGLGICLALAGCFAGGIGDLPSGPSTISVNGTWTGGFTDTSRSGRLTLTLSQSKVGSVPDEITGTWASTFTEAREISAGTVSGQSRGNFADLERLIA